MPGWQDKRPAMRVRQLEDYTGQMENMTDISEPNNLILNMHVDAKVDPLAEDVRDTKTV
jgi:hypothetical protein